MRQARLINDGFAIKTLKFQCLAAALLAVAIVVGSSGVARGQAAHRRPATARCAGKRSVQVTLTTARLADALRSMPTVQFCKTSLGYLPAIAVSDAVRYQRVQGFGAAMTDSSAWLLMTQLPVFTRDVVFASLFGPGGIRLGFVLVPMGASDFTATGAPYTYDDLPPGQTDPTLARFSTEHDLAYIIPALRQARGFNPFLRLIANPWSPPAWMKANDRLDNLSDSGQVLASDYPALARYFVKFLQSYAADGVSVNAITPQNEPGVQAAYPGALLDPVGEGEFISGYLEPALRAAGLSVGIYGDDLNWNSGSYATPLASGQAAGSLAGIAWHCYQGNPVEMSFFHAQFPALDQIVSECSPEVPGFSTIELLISALRNDATAALLWNIALDPAGGPVQLPNTGCGGCTGIVTVSEANHSVRLNPKYYQLGQVSKFVRPGAVRIASTSTVTYTTQTPSAPFSPSPGVDNVAFVNPDGSKVLVANNTSPTAQRFAVTWHGEAFRYKLARGATVTFTWR